MKIFLLLFCLYDRGAGILGAIKKITHNPIVNIAIVGALAMLTCMEKAKLVCPPDLIGDMVTSATDDWARRLEKNNPMKIAEENIKYYKQLKKKKYISQKKYKEFARFLKKRDFNLMRD